MTKPKPQDEKKRRGPKPQPLELPMDEIREMYDRYLAGATYAEIAEPLAWSPGRVQRLFDKAGIREEGDNHQHWVEIRRRGK